MMPLKQPLVHVVGSMSNPDAAETVGAETLEANDSVEQSVKDKMSDEERTYKADEELAIMKARAGELVETIRREDSRPVKVLYMTNKQAIEVSENSDAMKRMTDALCGRQKHHYLIIDLVQSWGFYNSTNIMGKKMFENTESNIWNAGIEHGTSPFESLEVEHETINQINQFMINVIIPLAEKTSAIVLCNAVVHDCILSECFTNMIEMMASKWHDNPPFAVVGTLGCVDCLYRHKQDSAKKDSATWTQIRNQCPAWKKRDELLKDEFDVKMGKGYHYNHDLSWKTRNLLIVEGLDTKFSRVKSKIERNKNRAPFSLLMTSLMRHIGKDSPQLAIKTGACTRDDHVLNWKSNGIQDMSYMMLKERANANASIVFLDVRKRPVHELLDPKHKAVSANVIVHEDGEDVLVDDSIVHDGQKDALVDEEKGLIEGYKKIIKEKNKANEKHSRTKKELRKEREEEVDDYTQIEGRIKEEREEEEVDEYTQIENELKKYGRIKEEREKFEKIKRKVQKEFEKISKSKISCENLDCCMLAYLHRLLCTLTLESSHPNKVHLHRAGIISNTIVNWDEKTAEKRKRSRNKRFEEKTISLDEAINKMARKKKEAKYQNFISTKLDIDHAKYANMFAWEFYNNLPDAPKVSDDNHDEHGNVASDDLPDAPKVSDDNHDGHGNVASDDLPDAPKEVSDDNHDEHGNVISDGDSERARKYFSSQIQTTASFAIQLLTYRRLYNINIWDELVDQACQIDQIFQKGNETEPTLEGLKLLKKAWDAVDSSKELANFYSRFSILLFKLQLFLGFLLTFLSVTVGYGIVPKDFEFLILWLSLFLGAFVTFDTIFSPRSYRYQLRIAQVRLESIIWKYRTRVGQFEVDQTNANQNRPEERLSRALKEWSEQLSGAKNPSATGMHGLWTGKKKKEGTSSKVTKDKDDHYSYLDGKGYVKFRLLQEKEGLLPQYEYNVPKGLFRQYKYHIVIVLLGVVIAIISGQIDANWGRAVVAILSALIASITSYMEFSDEVKAADMNTDAIKECQHLINKWTELTRFMTQSRDSTIELVEDVENVVIQVMTSWSTSITKKSGIHTDDSSNGNFRSSNVQGQTDVYGP